MWLADSSTLSHVTLVSPQGEFVFSSLPAVRILCSSSNKCELDHSLCLEFPNMLELELMDPFLVPCVSKHARARAYGFCPSALSLH
jgi:hypothetical protein